jgi:NAD-dependent SIR2 family protein deacetylase
MTGTDVLCMVCDVCRVFIQWQTLRHHIQKSQHMAAFTAVHSGCNKRGSLSLISRSRVHSDYIDDDPYPDGGKASPGHQGIHWTPLIRHHIMVYGENLKDMNTHTSEHREGEDCDLCVIRAATQTQI